MCLPWPKIAPSDLAQTLWSVLKETEDIYSINKEENCMNIYKRVLLSTNPFENVIFLHSQ